MVASALGLTAWFGMKTSIGSSFLGPLRCGHPLSRECVHSRSYQRIGSFCWSFIFGYWPFISFFGRVGPGHVFLCSVFRNPSVGCITCRMFFPSSFAPLAFSLRVQFPEWSVQPLVAVPWGEPSSVYSHIAVQFLADSDVYF